MSDGLRVVCSISRETGKQFSYLVSDRERVEWALAHGCLAQARDQFDLEENEEAEA